MEQATHTILTRFIDKVGASRVSRAHHRIKSYKNEYKPCDYSWEHDSTATDKPLEDHLQKTYRLVAARLDPWTPSGRIQNPLVVQVWQGILTAWERSVSESTGKGVRVLSTPHMGLEMYIQEDEAWQEQGGRWWWWWWRGKWQQSHYIHNSTPIVIAYTINFFFLPKPVQGLTAQEHMASPWLYNILQLLCMVEIICLLLRFVFCQGWKFLDLSEFWEGGLQGCTICWQISWFWTCFRRDV